MWAERLANATTFDSRHHRLSIEEFETVCDALIQANRVKTAVFKDYLNDSPRIADAIARLLSTSTTIETLTLRTNLNNWNTTIYTRGIRENRSLRVLEIPRLYGGSFVAALIDAISHHPRLEEFRIQNSGTLLTTIASQTLRRVSFRDVHYPNVYKMIDASPSLETLDMTRCTLGLVMTRHIAESIAKHPRLCRLVFDENPIGNDGAIALAGVIHRLQSLSLRRCGITDLERFAVSVQVNDVTTELVLDHNRLNELRGLDLIVPRLQKLEKLSIAKTETRRNGATFLARTIRSHSALRDVNLSENLTTNDGFVDVVAALMSRGLPCTVNAAQCMVTFNGFVRLSQFLGHAAPNATLDLDVSHNRHSRDCDAIARITRSPNVRALRAHNVWIGDGKLIAHAVADNPNLESLALEPSFDDDNAVRYDAAARILNVVARHPTLKRVEIYVDVRTKNHLDALVSAVDDNRRLERIGFGWVNNVAYQELIAAIWRSASLVDIGCKDQDMVDAVTESRAPDVLALLCFLSCVDATNGPLCKFARHIGDGALFISIAKALL
jgi:hypothetical protein